MVPTSDTNKVADFLYLFLQESNPSLQVVPCHPWFWVSLGCLLDFFNALGRAGHTLGPGVGWRRLGGWSRIWK